MTPVKPIVQMNVKNLPSYNKRAASSRRVALQNLQTMGSLSSALVMLQRTGASKIKIITKDGNDN